MKKSDARTHAHLQVNAHVCTNTLRDGLHTIHKMQTLNHHFISCRPFRPRVPLHPAQSHITTSRHRFVRAQDKNLKCTAMCEETQTNAAQENVIFITTPVRSASWLECVCLTAPVNWLKLMKSRLAPEEQQMFSRRRIIKIKVLGHFVHQQSSLHRGQVNIPSICKTSRTRKGRLIKSCSELSGADLLKKCVSDPWRLFACSICAQKQTNWVEAQKCVCSNSKCFTLGWGWAECHWQSPFKIRAHCKILFRSEIPRNTEELRRLNCHLFGL